MKRHGFLWQVVQHNFKMKFYTSWIKWQLALSLSSSCCCALTGSVPIKYDPSRRGGHPPLSSMCVSVAWNEKSIWIMSTTTSWISYSFFFFFFFLINNWPLFFSFPRDFCFTRVCLFVCCCQRVKWVSFLSRKYVNILAKNWYKKRHSAVGQSNKSSHLFFEFYLKEIFPISDGCQESFFKNE